MSNIITHEEFVEQVTKACDNLMITPQEALMAIEQDIRNRESKEKDDLIEELRFQLTQLQHERDLKEEYKQRLFDIAGAIGCGHIDESLVNCVRDSCNENLY